MTVSFNKHSGTTKITLSWPETRQLRSGMIKIEAIRDLVDKAYDLVEEKNGIEEIEINSR